MDTRGLSQREVERTGCRWVLELVERWRDPAQTIIDTGKSSRPAYIQRLVGDYIVPMWDQVVRTVEVKTERTHTGNLFLERWSNLTADASYRRDGWVMTLQADLLYYVFLDREVIYGMSLLHLKEWAVTEGNWYRYPEKQVHTFLDGGQKNNTIGHCAPLADMRECFGIREYNRRNGYWCENPASLIAPPPDPAWGPPDCYPSDRPLTVADFFPPDEQPPDNKDGAA